MKKNCCLFLAMIVAANVFADNTAATNAPAPNIVTKKSPPSVHHAKVVAKPATKPAAHVAKISEPMISLTPGTATVDADNVNYRGQAGLKGESIGQFKKGDTVTVLSVITLDKHAADEPAHWAKISLPAGAKVWVNKMFVTDKKVSVKKLNLRAGPGENFSVLGRVEKATSLNQLAEKGEWIQIAAPDNAYAFVSANYLRQGAMPEATPSAPFNPGSTPVVAGNVGAATQIPAGAETPVVVPTPTTVTDSAKISAPPSGTPAGNPTPTPIKLANLPPPPPETAEVETNAPPRIVTHEGWVRDSVSIVAPTYYELYDQATDKAIDYLHSPSPLLSVVSYKGKHIVVTGEEALDAQWKDTPVLTIQKIYVLSGSPAAAAPKPAPAPAAAKATGAKHWYYLWLK
jgi:uncharacterized protein YgiM (DUF1202 family)